MEKPRPTEVREILWSCREEVAELGNEAGGIDSGHCLGRDVTGMNSGSPNFPVYTLSA